MSSLRCECPLALHHAAGDDALCQSAQEAAGTWDCPCDGCPCDCHVPPGVSPPAGACLGCGLALAACTCPVEYIGERRWLCGMCGSFHTFCCPVTGQEPPWGCSCAAHEEGKDEDE